MSRFQEEFFGKTETRHDELVMKCVSSKGIDRIIKTVGWKCDTSKFDVDYETEVICQTSGYKSNFIVGYADIVIKMVPDWSKTIESDAEARVKLLVEKFHVPESEARRSARNYYKNDLAGTAKILVECKPELKDIGTTIRQLKTYESILKADCVDWFKAIATYSLASEDTTAYLLHEGIHVINFQ